MISNISLIAFEITKKDGINYLSLAQKEWSKITFIIFKYLAPILPLCQSAHWQIRVNSRIKSALEPNYSAINYFFSSGFYVFYGQYANNAYTILR